MKIKAFIAALALSACSPPAPNETAPPPAAAAAPEVANEAMLAALTPLVSAAIGQPVSFTIDTVRVDNDWAWLVVQPQAADGSPLDWSQTSFASAYANGVLGDNGATYALLRREAGEWRVVDHVIGPTDVAYIDWPARHGAPPELLGLAE
ncbi:hypothetical protein [Terricaulis sp.]|uniref:hypothetical protein n=1 Tax=Terricaulis sp. TaxID=2768686 RepID=UPI002AC70582|nr:hypothetical protein [Terricaulis sp.]MDZ4693055.1 hypothetical protein [Terricaulis sp.]